MTIWKYDIPIIDHFELDIPSTHRMLTVQVQGDAVSLWVLVDENEETERIGFRLAGTGHPLEEGEAWNYIGTFQLFGGKCVYHLGTIPS
jgi:hypothetical protein